MKLSFLGRSYDANPAEIETPQAPTTNRFLGKNYQPRRPLNIHTEHKGTLRFRGIEY